MLRPYKENRTVLKNCLTVDLGLLGYAEAYALQKRVVAARKGGAIEDVLLLCEHPHVITRRRHYLPRAGTDGGISDSEPGRDPAGRRVVRADAGRGDDPGNGGVRNYRGACCRKDGNLGARRKYRRKAGGHRRAHQPLGYVAWIRVQRVDGFAEFRFDRAVRDRRPESHVAGEIAGAQGRRKGSCAADREASGKIARAGDEGSVEERFA